MAEVRFASVCSVEEFILQQENKNTAQKTERDVRLLERFLKTKNEDRKIEDIPAVELNFPASRGPFSFVFAELTDGTKRDLCHGSKLPLIQPPSMVVDGGFRNACSLYCLLTVT